VKTSTSAPSERVSLGRYPERGSYERETIAAILDEALICHVGLAIDEQPLVIPTTYARIGDCLYIHGSPVARWLKHLRDAAPLCVTVTLLDGLVLARSAFRHSMNYRSVVILGRASVVDESGEKLRALEAIIEHTATGRWRDGIRHPSDSELKATLVLRIPLDEASAKLRSGGPKDLEEDMTRHVWAGHLPLALTPAEAVADESNLAAPPDYIRRYRR
jgi:uncharacterized protein